jgi:hypothetical protein
MEHEIFKRVFKDKGSSDLTPIVYLMKELGCLDSVLGSEYSVFDKNGNKIYTIKKETLNMTQINVLLEELDNIVKLQNKKK